VLLFAKSLGNFTSPHVIDELISYLFVFITEPKCDIIRNGGEGQLELVKQKSFKISAFSDTKGQQLLGSIMRMLSSLLLKKLYMPCQSASVGSAQKRELRSNIGKISATLLNNIY
jgi:hypothetical protein